MDDPQKVDDHVLLDDVVQLTNFEHIFINRSLQFLLA